MIINNSFIKILIVIMILLLSVSCKRIHKRSELIDNERIEMSSSKTLLSKNIRNSIIKIHKDNGVFYIPCKINGTEMEFIFDTGASDITMSLTEALFLYKQGKLKDEDFQGTQQYQIADGSIHEGMIVNLRKVVIGNWELNNVQASIVDNMEAPLLLGQSALAAFGKISIDYNRNVITFE